MSSIRKDEIKMELNPNWIFILNLEKTGWTSVDRNNEAALLLTVPAPYLSRLQRIPCDGVVKLTFEDYNNMTSHIIDHLIFMTLDHKGLFLFVALARITIYRSFLAWILA